MYFNRTNNCLTSLHICSPSAFSNQEVYQQVTNGYRMPAPAKCPDFFYKIMLKCWSFEPADRPDFKSLKLKLDSSSYELEWPAPSTSCSTHSGPQRGSRESDTELGFDLRTLLLTNWFYRLLHRKTLIVCVCNVQTCKAWCILFSQLGLQLFIIFIIHWSTNNKIFFRAETILKMNWQLFL